MSASRFVLSDRTATIDRKIFTLELRTIIVAVRFYRRDEPWGPCRLALIWPPTVETTWNLFPGHYLATAETALIPLPPSRIIYPQFTGMTISVTSADRGKSKQDDWLKLKLPAINSAMQTVANWSLSLPLHFVYIGFYSLLLFIIVKHGNKDDLWEFCYHGRAN